MNRRDFLAKFSKTAAVAGASTTAVVVGARAKSRIGAADVTDRIRGRVRALEKRIDQMDASQRRFIRILAIAITVSTGVDVATLL